MWREGRLNPALAPHRVLSKYVLSGTAWLGLVEGRCAPSRLAGSPQKFVAASGEETGVPDGLVTRDSARLAVRLHMPTNRQPAIPISSACLRNSMRAGAYRVHRFSVWHY